MLSRWPLIQHARLALTAQARKPCLKRQEFQTKHHGAEVTRSICPYCGVGCGQLVFHKQGKLISIEGDPQSPISRGHLCPKGADTYQLHTIPKRLTRVKYRRPYSRESEEIELETAMDMVADRVWEDREKSFQETRDGKPLMQTTTIAHLGGATLDNEENYLIKKLFTAGLGMVCLSNQAENLHSPPCPVWAHRSDAAAPPLLNKISRTRTPSSLWGRRWRRTIRWASVGDRGPRTRGQNSRRSAFYAHFGHGGHLGAPARRQRHSVLGGLIDYVLQHNREFRQYVAAYTNASTLSRHDFKDTEA